ncbi:MAG: hypothetical protein KF851_14280 [Pirellulaceae bacterium]|nr:hypothetical protein [Pirellulaceae bacterium]
MPLFLFRTFQAFLLLSVFCGAGQIGSAQALSPTSKPQSPSINELRERTKRSLQNFRGIEDHHDFAAVLLDMCWLHKSIVLHPDFENSPTLQNRRAEISSVLKKVVGELQVTERQRERLGSSDRTYQSPLELHAGESISAGSREIESWDFMQSRAFDQITGGPLATLGQLPGNFAPPFTDRELISLITATVSPSSWRINGGEGTAEYYSPALALVVFNSQQVQDEICDLLRQLR